MIVDASIADGTPLGGFAMAARSRAGRALARRGIALLSGQVIAVEADAVRVQSADGEQMLPSVATAWVTGPSAPPWLAESGLQCDDRGYPLIDDSLALTADGTAFGAGDCVTLRHAPQTPKAGVFAVRMAPILAANVRAAMMGLPSAERYTPQANYLALLSTGDGSALLSWRGVALESRWAHHLKRWIDDRYLRRYRALADSATK
jgi:selenide,water dikinase